MTPDQAKGLILRDYAFVYIVDSPDPNLLYAGCTEGNSLAQTLRLAGISVLLNTVVNRPLFATALSLDQLKLAATMSKKAFPLVHIAAHGSQEGIELTDKDHLRWRDLGTLLEKINTEMALNALLVTISSCEGLKASSMAHKLGGGDPYNILVGHPGDLLQSDAVIGYAAFYHHLMNKLPDPEKALNAARVASGDQRFSFSSARDERKSYAEWLLGEAQNTLKQLQPST